MLLFFVIAFVFAIGIANFARQRYDTALFLGRRAAPLSQTAGELAREFLDAFDCKDVRIVEHNAFITDYYDHKRRCLFLQRAVLNGKSQAAWAVALHEAAHGVQARGMGSALEMRAGNIRLTRYVPTLATLFVLLLGVLKRPPLGIGWKILVAVWGVVMALNAMSLPIEFHASRLALGFLEKKLRTNAEALEQLNLVLKGVAWRDTAAFLRSPRYCLSALSPVSGNLRPK